MKKSKVELEGCSAVIQNIEVIFQSVDKKGKLVFVNSAWLQKLGYTEKEAIGMSVWKIISPKYKKECNSIYKLAASGKKYKNVESELLRKDGKKILVRGDVIPYKENGKLKYIITACKDITELKIDAEKYKSFIMNHRGISYFAKLNGIPILFDGNVNGITGYKRDSFLSGRVNWKNLILKEDFKRMSKNWKYLAKIHGTSVKREYRIRKKNGKIIWVQDLVRNVVDEKGKIVLVQGEIYDITDKRISEEKLIREKNRVEGYFDVADVMLIIIGKDGKVLEINHKGREILGYPEKEIIGKNWFNTFLPSSVRGDVKKVFKKILDGKEKLVEYYENPILDKYGKEKIISWHNSLLFDEKNEIVGILSSGEDITKRKHVEGELQNYHLFLEDKVRERTRELEENEEKYRTIVNNLNVGIYRNTGGTHGKFLEANPAIVSMFGYTSVKDFMKVKVSSLYQKPSERKLYIKEVLKKGYVKDFELKLKKKDGTPIIGSLTSKIVYNKKGDINWIDGTIEDITKRKKSEQMLKESEKRFRTIFEGANDGILAVNPKTKKFVFANIKISQLTGYKIKDLLKMGINDIHPKEELKNILKIFEKQISGKETLAKALPILRKDKKIIYCDVNAQKLHLSGEILFVGFFRDVTKQIETQKILVESEQKFRTLYQSSKDAIMTLTPPTWRFTAGNLATIKMFKAKNEKDFVSHDPWELSPKYQLDGQLSSVKAKKMIQKAMKEGSNFFEWTHKRINGKTFPATVLLSKIENKDEYLQATVRDITDQKINEEKIKYQIEKLKEMDELKSKFLTVTSHELKTPITPIKLQTQMLMEGHFGELSKNQKVSTKIIYRNINRLQKLIEDILEIARMQSAGYKYHFTKNDLNLLVKDVIENSKVTANKKGLFIKYTTQTKLSKVQLDKTRITQVITNLLDNAIKFTEKGGINVNLKKMKNNLILTVKDTGIGIPEEHQDKVFEEFYQVEPTYTREHGGAGLGLSIAKKIINAHNGEIWLKSKFGEGSTFSFSIPIINGGENEKNTDSR